MTVIPGSQPLPGSADPTPPKGATMIGQDAEGQEWCYVLIKEDVTHCASIANDTSSNQQLKYVEQVGSTIGFSQKFGVSVTATGGIDFGFFSASLSTTISGEVAFSQAFSEIQRTETTATAAPGCITSVYEATLVMQYYKKIKTQVSMYFYTEQWVPAALDVVETNVYVTKETPIPAEALEAVAEKAKAP